jgi:putative ABC transport system permease protein
MNDLERFVLSLADNPLRLAGAAAVLVAVAAVVYYRKPVVFILKSLARNKLRTILTGLATAVFVLLVTMVWSVVVFLDRATQEKSKDLKAIVTERWQIPSQMPFAYAQPLSEGAPHRDGDVRVRPENSMTWQFFGGTLEQAKPTRENMVFFFCMEPSKVMTMMDGIDKLSAADRAKLEAGLEAMTKDPRKVVIGEQRLEAMNKRVGEHIRVYSFNYKDIVLDDVEIIGAFPKGQYGQSAVMNRERLNNALDAYKQQNGKPHPMADRTLNLVWLKVPDTNTYNQVADQVEHSPLFTVPAVKCETASSGVASFLDAYKSLLDIVKWLLVPVLMFCMALVICAAISISVRERRTEMAVLKVLGYTPLHILGLVLGEALVLGCTAGLLSAGFAYVLFTQLMGGIPVPIAFFPAFMVPVDALWWGLGLGAGTALVGSIIPALIACSIKVSEVFAKVS